MRCRTTALAFDLSTIPLHSRCPLFDASASTWLPSGSIASAKYSPSSTQKSRLKRRLSVAACFLQLVGEGRRRARSHAPGARRASWRRTRSPGARTSRAGSRAGGRRGTRSSPRSPSSTGSRARSPRCGACTRRSRCPGGWRTRRASSSAARPRTRAPARAWCRRSSARTRRAARRTAAWRRRSRSRGSAAAPRRRSSRRSASRGGCGRDPRRGSRRCAFPGACRARAGSSPRVAARTGSDCRHVKMLSRPNIVMNHGSPAAGRLRLPAVIGENRNAARSTRLR